MLNMLQKLISYVYASADLKTEFVMMRKSDARGCIKQ